MVRPCGTNPSSSAGVQNRRPMACALGTEAVTWSRYEGGTPPMSPPPTEAQPAAMAAAAARRIPSFMELLTGLAARLFPLLLGLAAADLLHALGIAQHL